MALKVNEPIERLIGSLPKVGIRPTIDGRRKGVRESLEKTTMDMAESAAELISSAACLAFSIKSSFFVPYRNPLLQRARHAVAANEFRPDKYSIVFGFGFTAAY